MAQQPNIVAPAATEPATKPAPAATWDPSTRPGVITRPEEMPRGGPFGNPGPDPGWALRLVKRFDLPERSPAIEAIVAALASARAAAFGRAPVPEDVRVALALCGYGDNLPAHLIERRKRWIEAVPHEKSKGQTAVAEVEPDLLVQTAERIRYAVNRSG